MRLISKIETFDGATHVSHSEAVAHCENSAAHAFQKLAIKLTELRKYQEILTYLMTDEVAQDQMRKGLKYLDESKKPVSNEGNDD